MDEFLKVCLLVAACVVGVPMAGAGILWLSSKVLF